jgi:hypothetical protein
VRYGLTDKWGCDRGVRRPHVLASEMADWPTAFFQRNNSDSTVGRLRAGAKFDGPRQRPELTEPILFPSRG